MIRRTIICLCIFFCVFPFGLGAALTMVQLTNRNRTAFSPATNLDRARIDTAFKKFNALYHDKWEAGFQPLTHRIESLYGYHTDPLGPDREKAGREFLTANQDLLGIDQKALTFLGEKPAGPFIHTKYQQYYKDIPVENGYVKMSFLKDGRLIWLKSGYVLVSLLSVLPKITESEAFQKVLDDLKPSRYRAETMKARLVIYPRSEDGKTYLCYKVELFSEAPLGSFIYYIDALNSEVLFKMNDLRFSGSWGTVKGLIKPLYDIDPRQTNAIRNSYVKIRYVNPVPGIDTVTSSNNAMGSFASTYSGTNMTAFLEGPHFKAVNEDVPNATNSMSPAKPTNVKMVWSATDTHLDEINVFYHLERIRNHYTNTFQEMRITQQMKAYVHYSNYYDNAFYEPFSGDLYFGDGNHSDIKDLALFADIIYHEYTHGITDHIYDPGLFYFGESGALSEAFSDYFACSFLNDSRIGEFCFTGAASSLVRNLDWTSGLKKFPDNWTGEVHADSLIFSQALWEIRSGIGTNTTDKLLYQAMHFEPDTFDGVRIAMLLADDVDGDLSNGTPHKGAMDTAFSHHGIPLSSSSYVNDTFEPNNGFSEAYPVKLNQDYASYISIPGDMDFYSLSLTPRDRAASITVTVSLPYYGYVTGVDDIYYAYDLFLYDSNRELVDFYTIYMGYLINGSVYTPVSLLSLIFRPTDSLYYLQIVASAGYPTSSSSKSYDLKCSSVAENLSGVQVFPNPYKPGKNSSSGYAYDGSYRSGIIFQGITGESEIKIFDLKGLLVFSKKLTDNNWFQWDAKDSQGKDAPSGVYLYLISNSKKQKQTGKFAIIR